MNKRLKAEGKPVAKKCKRCKKWFDLGVSGIAGGLCDKCAGITRDAEGNALYAWEIKK